MTPISTVQNELIQTEDIIEFRQYLTNIVELLTGLAVFHETVIQPCNFAQEQRDLLRQVVHQTAIDAFKLNPARMKKQRRRFKKIWLRKKKGFTVKSLESLIRRILGSALSYHEQLATFQRRYTSIPVMILQSQLPPIRDHDDNVMAEILNRGPTQLKAFMTSISEQPSSSPGQKPRRLASLFSRKK